MILNQHKAFKTGVTLFFMICCFAIGGYLGKTRGIPFIRKECTGSIGVFTGETPFKLCSGNIKNPVLRVCDINDIPASFLGDPFMVKENGTWYMFFEVMNAKTFKADIGLAESKDGFKWNYKRIVLHEPFHLSYPYVFKWNDEYYMIPETHQAYAVRLYKAIQFPTKWSYVKDLFKGNFSDSSIFFHQGRFWIFTSDRYDVLRLFYSRNLLGPWLEHIKSPIILGNKKIARPAGRILAVNNRIYRFAQDCEPVYGTQVRAMEITKLTPEEYSEHEIIGGPILKGTGSGWNGVRMHHIDAHPVSGDKWLACVDGFGFMWVWSLDY